VITFALQGPADVTARAQWQALLQAWQGRTPEPESSLPPRRAVITLKMV
jgi:hypothetical protein